MRSVFAFLTVLALAIGPTLAAQADTPADAPADAPATSTAKTRQARLDKLFSDLGRERNEKAAERIAGTIWQAWLDSGSANINLMMLWAQKAMEAQKFDVALDFLDQVTTLDPTYAEGWNRRATVHYMMKNYAKSLADIERTLQLEPRHFGALSGMARIMADTGHKQAALDAWQRVLAIYPMMRSAQSEVSTLSEELAGEGI
ncbi:tetratricopeptide repeat protein [Aquamicrobium soli]|jgi:tetratricopeptide (TPR) repeat protein|uniref:Tetratricopeptide repeat protein n=1 Tax=Aquamicrobium soli TaxID=1811518 RepID=A0ABV7KCD7_9HYPH